VLLRLKRSEAGMSFDQQRKLKLRICSRTSRGRPVQGRSATTRRGREGSAKFFSLPPRFERNGSVRTRKR